MLTAGAHTLDAGNTEVTLEVWQFGLRWLSAQFRQLSGQFTPAQDGGRLDVVVRTDSIDCRDGEWNVRLRSAQWLDTVRFPEMVYHSTRIEVSGASALVQGELTLHGVTRPLALHITGLACGRAPQGTALACRFEGRGELRRSEFGLPHGTWQGGDLVQVRVRGFGG
ncbi:MAG: polyisoprenoid-binding protein [Gammaproteobacteria bacterium]|nr:polyisoprenoid-binding protein [Gammaproteobacteria bacterium]